MENNKKIIRIEYQVINSLGKLSGEDQTLFEKASLAAHNAYAPYSTFRVGAALLLEGATIVSGSNQENAAYPSGLCAERVAMFAASAQNPGQKMTTLIVVGRDKLGNSIPVTPCGACRQVLLEYEDKQNSPIKIITTGKNEGFMIFPSASSLLPFGFRNAQLPA